MKYSGAEIIIRLLEIHGIKIVEGIPGGANLPLYDALYKSGIRHILARHEQGAGFMAQGMARSTGLPAVCFATSGPGATNLITAIADAKLDSVPVIAITGQVPSSLIGTDAFQEVDTYGMTIPITKHNFLVKKAEELLSVIPESFRLAASGRPGPVLVDVPKDVQLEKIEVNEWPSRLPVDKPPAPDDNVVREAAKAINASERPVLYIGGGAISAGAGPLILDLAMKASIPVSSTLMGIGAVASDHPLYAGMIGMHAWRRTNDMFRESDLIMALGVRFDDRATGKVDAFCPGARIIHVDIDGAELNKNKRADISVISGLAEFLNSVIPLIERKDRREWIDKNFGARNETPEPGNVEPGYFGPKRLLSLIARSIPGDSIITTDVGQHQMWTAQYYPVKKPRTLLTSSGLGTMGFGMPAAIGAALAYPERTVVAICGDGSILMNLQELAVISEERLNVKVIIFNNGHLGLVRQQQELFYGKNYIASTFSCRPDFCLIARGFGIESYDLGSVDDPEGELKKALAVPGPCVINAPIMGSMNVYPMVVPGGGNHEMIGGE
jgi:acetolactate synthase-1/2/3 large subunit